jgi:hypothetical protein
LWWLLLAVSWLEAELMEEVEQEEEVWGLRSMSDSVLHVRASCRIWYSLLLLSLREALPPPLCTLRRGAFPFCTHTTNTLNFKFYQV